MFSVTCFFFNNIEIESSDNITEDKIVRRQKNFNIDYSLFLLQYIIVFLRHTLHLFS